MTFDPFCDSEQTEKSVFFESKYFMLLYDVKPVVPGHILFVPKRHVLDFTELNDEEEEDFHKTFKEIVPRILKIYGSTENSYDFVSQVGRYSGRSVEHLHIHVLPRSKNDAYSGRDNNIFDDLKLNRSNFGHEHVENEVARLRKEFGFKQK